jgi:hypothetical protein
LQALCPGGRVAWVHGKVVVKSTTSPRSVLDASRAFKPHGLLPKVRRIENEMPLSLFLPYKSNY